MCVKVCGCVGELCACVKVCARYPLIFAHLHPDELGERRLEPRGVRQVAGGHVVHHERERHAQQRREPVPAPGNRKPLLLLLKPVGALGRHSRDTC